MSTHLFDAVEMDAQSAHTYESPDDAIGHVTFNLRGRTKVSRGSVSIHGTREERLVVLEAWARAEGVAIARPVVDDYGHEVLVPA